MKHEIPWEVHPAADRFQMLEGDEFDKLVRDVKANGVRVPLVFDSAGRLLDGRNRTAAAIAAGLDPDSLPCEHFEGDDLDCAFLVIRLNILRRHLTPGQRAMIGVDLLPGFEAEARDRMLAGKADPVQDPVQGTADKSSDKAAAAVGVSRETIRLAKKIRSEDPELARRVESGEISVEHANDILDRRRLESTAPGLLQLVLAGRATVKESLRLAKKLSPDECAAVAAKVLAMPFDPDDTKALSRAAGEVKEEHRAAQVEAYAERAPTGDLPADVDLRLGNYRDVLADATWDTTIVDPPYGHQVHDGQSKRTDFRDGNIRRDLSYSNFTPEDVREFVEFCAPRTRGWFAVMSCHALRPVWYDELERAGLYAFAPVFCIIPGMTVRLCGDGPSSEGVYLTVARPQSLSRWGTLPGYYLHTRKGDQHIGGKPLAMMQAIVGDYSKPGDLICDPCAGRATTAHAALSLGRKFIGSEIDKATYNKAREGF